MLCYLWSIAIIITSMENTAYALYTAVEQNNVAVVQQILATGIDPNLPIFTGGPTPLITACESNSLDVVRLLITNQPIPADPNVSFYGRYPLHVAVKEGYVKMVKVLVREGIVKPDLNAEVGMQTPLLAAIYQNNFAMVNLLLKAGADAKKVIQNKTIQREISPLLEAIYVRRLDILGCLVYHGSDVSRVIVERGVHYSALTQAVQRQNLPIIQYLVENCNADIFVGNGRVLVHAIETKRADILDYLLQQASKQLDDTWWHGSILSAALENRNYSPSVLIVLLRWGIYTVPNKIGHQTFPYTSKTQSIFSKVAVLPCLNSINILTTLYPQCLQESWFIKKTPDGIYYQFGSNQDVQEVMTRLKEERKHPARLTDLCRTVILKQVKYNPIPKIEQLPLPKILKEFVQCREVFEI